MNYLISRIQVGTRARRDLGDIATLARSIASIGLLHPPVITPSGQLIAGQRRLEAVRRLGWRTVPVTIVDLENIAEGELAENITRKDFLPSELWACASAVRELLQSPRGRPSKKRANCPLNGRTRDRTAKAFGVSGRQLEKIGAVMESSSKKLIEEMDANPRSVNRCYIKARALEEQRKAKRHKLQTGPYHLVENSIVCADAAVILPQIPSSTFHAVVTDPPFGTGKVYNGRREPGRDPESYGAWFGPIWKECLRVLKPGGFFCVFQASPYMRYLWNWFADVDFVIYAACVAGKVFFGGQPIACAWNPVIIGYKGKPKYRPADFSRARNWFASNSAFDQLARAQPTPEPLDQCEELVRSFTCRDALVLLAV